MSRRIEIELTSKLSDSEWTWRAAGAKLPKGTLEAGVLYEGASVGDVARADADFALDGVTITATKLVAGKRSEAKAVQKIEVKGSDKKFEGVTSQLVEKGSRGKGGPRGDRPDRPRGDRPDRPRGPRPERTGGPGGPRGERTGGPGGPRGDRPARPGGERTGGPRGPRPDRAARPEAPSFKRLTPKDTNRKAVLDTLSPEDRVVADQVLRGGIPAVRQAIEAENTKAKAEGRPEVNSTALLALAEELLPQLTAAQWMDRAIAAQESVDEISVRDLRSVVTGADAIARTDEARLIAASLREALERRVNESRAAWVKDITTSLEEGRTVRALRLSSRPPDPQTKFPPELMDRLKTSAEEAMSPDTAPDRWVTLLDAVGASPVRRSVEPKGLPAEPGEELTNAAKQAAGRIPALAKLLGLAMPPPPRPLPPKPAPKNAAPASTEAEAPASEAPAAEAAPAAE